MSTTAVGEVSEREGTLASGGARLHWRAALPAGAPWAYLALVHGYGEHSGRHAHFLRWLAERGVACYAVDLRGHGKAEGRRGACSRWDDYVDDTRGFLAMEELRARESKPLFVLGHSHGGLIVAAAAIEGLPGAAGCILSAPFFHNQVRVPGYKVLLARLIDPVVPWLPLPSNLEPEWMSSDEAMVRDSRSDTLVHKVATPRWYLGCTARQEEVLHRAGELRLPLLVLMGDADRIADPRAAHDFFERAGSEDKTYRLYPDHLHELLREREREHIFEHVLAWLRERAG